MNPPGQPNGAAAVRTPWRVLIFPGGTEIGLELRQALAWCKEVELFSAGAPVSSHAPYVFASHDSLPLVGEPGWCERLVELLRAKKITHIFPAHDDALLSLKEHEAQLPAKVVSAPLETCRLARSKAATLARLANIVPVPQIFATPGEVNIFPVFLKPDRGQGAQRTDCAHDRQELEALLRADADRLIVEHLPGPEFTVDCFSDRERGLLYARARARRRIRTGIAMDSRFIVAAWVQDYAERISREVKFHGAWFFQVKAAADGQLKLLEIAPRIGGTSGLSRVCGVNLPLLSLYEAERIPVSLHSADFDATLDRALVSRFQHALRYRTVYVDLDDTLIVRGRVNPALVRLMFQSLNAGRRLVLLTRHAGDLRATLKKFRLENLFDEVIHLQAGESKAAHVTDREAVFVDDSHRERKEVQEKTGVPGFGPDMIELLLDDRV